MIRILLILILVSLSNPTFADVEFHKLDFKDSKGHEYVSLKVTGHLKISDVDEFKKYIKQIHKEHLRLEKDSVELDSQVVFVVSVWTLVESFVKNIYQHT